MSDEQRIFALLDMGDNFFDAGNYPLARDCFVQVLQYEHTHPYALNMLARIEICEQNYSKAYNVLRMNLTNNPQDEWSFILLGLISLQKST